MPKVHPKQKHLLLQGVLPSFITSTTEINTSHVLQSFQEGVCTEVLDFVNEAAHTSSTVSQDDTYVLFITDSIYANIINKKLSAGQSTKVNVQDAADRLTEGVTVHPHNAATSLCNDWVVNGVTHIDTKPGNGQVWVVVVDVREAMAYYDQRYPGKNSEDTAVTLSRTHAEFHSLMWLSQIEIEYLESNSQLHYYQYVMSAIALQAVRTAPILAPFFHYCDAHELVFRGGGQHQRHEKADSVSIAARKGSRHSGGNGTRGQQIILFYGDSVALRMSVLMEEARVRQINDCDQEALTAVKGSGRGSGSGDGCGNMDAEVVEHLKTITFSSLEKLFFFSEEPLVHYDHYNSKKRKPHLLGKYTEYIAKMQVSTVVLSFTLYISDVGQNLRRGFEAFLHELVVLRSLNVQRVYVQDGSVSWNILKDNPDVVRTYNYSDPHSLHRVILKSFSQYFDQCETYLLSWNGSIVSDGPCVTSSSYFLLKAKAANKPNTLDSNQYRTKSAAGAIFLQAFKDIQAMLVILELTYFTCPHISPVTKACTNKGWGFFPLLADGMHPSGKAGRFIARGELGVLAQDMVARTKQEASRTRVHPGEQFSVYA